MRLSVNKVVETKVLVVGGGAGTRAKIEACATDCAAHLYAIDMASVGQR